MEAEVIFGDRLIIVKCLDDRGWPIFDKLYEQMLSFENEVKNLMDWCEIPREIILNFKLGDESLYGQYFIQEKEVSKELIVIDIYIRRWVKNKSKFKEGKVDVEVFDTFIHEIIHNKYAGERKTRKTVKQFLSDL